MKSKVGNFFFAFVPLALILTILYISQLPGTGLYMVFKFLTEGGEGLGSFLYSILFTGLDGDEYNNYAYFIQLVYSILAIVVFVFWNRIFHKDKIKGNVATHIASRFDWQILLGILLMAVGSYYLVDIIISLEASILPDQFEIYTELMEDMDISSEFNVGIFLYAIIFGHVCEELCFRGAIYRHFRKAVPVWAALILQAALFGVFHGNVIQGVYAFIVGILMGYIYEHGGSIFNNILYHVLFNVMGLTTILSSFMDERVIWVLFVLGAGVGFTACGLLLYSFGVKKRDNVICSSSCPY